MRPSSPPLGLVLLGTVWLFSVYVLPLPATPFNLVLCLWAITVIVGIVVSGRILGKRCPKATGLILGLGAWRPGSHDGANAACGAGCGRPVAPVEPGASALWAFSACRVPKNSGLAQLNPFQPGRLPGFNELVVHPIN